MSGQAMRTEWMEFRTDDASVFVGKDCGNTTDMRFRLLLPSKKDGGPIDVSWSLNGHAVRQLAMRLFPDAEHSLRHPQEAG